MIHRSLLLVGLLALTAGVVSAAEDRLKKVLSDRTEVTAAGLWIYDDLDKGFAEAKRTGKPLLAVFR